MDYNEWNYYANHNRFITQSTSSCVIQDDPIVTFTFNSTMLTTEPSGNQWSVQTNANPSVAHDVDNMVWMQFNMAVNSSDWIYGSIQDWNGSTPAWSSQEYGLAQETSVQSGDYLKVALNQNDSGGLGVWQVNFTYYNSASGHSYTKVVSPPSSVRAPVVYWMSNLVSENSGTPNVNFTSGGGTITYSSSSMPTVYLSSGLPPSSCVEGNNKITNELSNSIYAIPTTSGSPVEVKEGMNK